MIAKFYYHPQWMVVEFSYHLLMTEKGFSDILGSKNMSGVEFIFDMNLKLDDVLCQKV